MTTKKDLRLEPSEASQHLLQVAMSLGQRKHLNTNKKQRQHLPWALSKHGNYFFKKMSKTFFISLNIFFCTIYFYFFNLIYLVHGFTTRLNEWNY